MSTSPVSTHQQQQIIQSAGGEDLSTYCNCFISYRQLILFSTRNIVFLSHSVQQTKKNYDMRENFF